MNSKSLTAVALTLATALTLGTFHLSSAAEDPSTAFPEREGRQGGHFLMHLLKGPRENVESILVKTEDGAVATITTDDAEVLEKLQSMAERELPEQDLVNVDKQLLDNGVQVTVSTDDEDILEKIHGMIDKKELMDSITHSHELIDNGVVMTITSDNAEAVEQIQSRPEKEPKNEDITVVREELSNGVRITITSDDEELVQKIQDRAENGPEKGFHKGRGGKKGPRGAFGGERKGFGQSLELPEEQA